MATAHRHVRRTDFRRHQHTAEYPTGAAAAILVTSLTSFVLGFALGGWLL